MTFLNYKFDFVTSLHKFLLSIPYCLPSQLLTWPVGSFTVWPLPLASLFFLPLSHSASALLNCSLLCALQACTHPQECPLQLLLSWMMPNYSASLISRVPSFLSLKNSIFSRTLAVFTRFYNCLCVCFLIANFQWQIIWGVGHFFFF